MKVHIVDVRRMKRKGNGLEILYHWTGKRSSGLTQETAYAQAASLHLTPPWAHFLCTISSWEEGCTVPKGMWFGVRQSWVWVRLLWLWIAKFLHFNEPHCSYLYSGGQYLLKRLYEIICVAISKENGHTYVLTWRQHWNMRLQWLNYRSCLQVPEISGKTISTRQPLLEAIVSINICM